MKKRDFIIPFVGLKEDIHEFQFELDESFFKTTDQLFVVAPKIVATLHFDKTHEPYVLDFRISGHFKGECDRCASNIDIPVDGRFRLFVEFDNIDNEDETEVIYLPRDSHDVDLYDHIRDFAYLSIPMVKRCETEADLIICDEKVDSFMKKVNTQVESKEEIDPRWASLKQLKK